MKLTFAELNMALIRSSDGLSEADNWPTAGMLWVIAVQPIIERSGWTVLEYLEHGTASGAFGYEEVLARYVSGRWVNDVQTVAKERDRPKQGDSAWLAEKIKLEEERGEFPPGGATGNAVAAYRRKQVPVPLDSVRLEPVTDAAGEEPEGFVATKQESGYSIGKECVLGRVLGTELGKEFSGEPGDLGVFEDYENCDDSEDDKAKEWRDTRALAIDTLVRERPAGSDVLSIRFGINKLQVWDDSDDTDADKAFYSVTRGAQEELFASVTEALKAFFQVLE